ncbi:S53 family peptidase [Kutzneria chonburiensis]|uniref:S53 family peptidase n=1 Tax=Kutzneria chonburiensis TaxID=1483604 RepID=A0ABV6N8W5_9PSEU|nr:S53 family peptidase [Kutzneria chonburiensis]
MTKKVLTILAVVALWAGVSALSGPAQAQTQNPSTITTARSCAETPAPGFAACKALVRTDAGARSFAPAAPAGLSPANLKSAYKLGAGGAGLTVAIVDAQDDPKAESDLAVYRSTFGLPACTTANGCFKKVNQNGAASPLPAGNTGWAEEISLDLDMVSAICPSCHILLVEATTASINNLGTAVNTAVRLGAVAVSNSYGGAEFSTETSADSFYNHPGVAITVSSGDSGFGVEYPAASRFVTAVGGTHLTAGGGTRGWTETAWSGAGSGCSRFEAKPTWQHDTGCARRTVADVSAVADPATGVAVYDTYNVGGWLVFGGTSVAAPVIAGVYALAGRPAAGSNPASLAYSHTGSLFDVTSGSNGSCGGSYLCTAKAGYDGPTGLGTPNGTGAF